MTTRALIRVEGQVQGVFFRQSALEMATGLGLCGWVRNLADGSVEALFEGERDRVEAAVAWCRQGPPRASVSALDCAWLDGAPECTGFTIRY